MLKTAARGGISTSSAAIRGSLSSPSQNRRLGTRSRCQNGSDALRQASRAPICPATISAKVRVEAWRPPRSSSNR